MTATVATEMTDEDDSQNAGHRHDAQLPMRDSCASPNHAPRSPVVTQRQVAVEHHALPWLRHPRGGIANVAIVRRAAAATPDVGWPRALPPARHSFALIATAVPATNALRVTSSATTSGDRQSCAGKLQAHLPHLEVATQSNDSARARRAKQELQLVRTKVAGTIPALRCLETCMPRIRGRTTKIPTKQ